MMIDPHRTNVPFPSWDLTNRPLRVGLVTSDRYYEACPAVSRALEEAAAALRASGHEVVPVELPCTGWEIIQVRKQRGVILIH
jgi:Asp-tRNA(Asn)/Glu-tRNA(Gln) amidotransferase A subunit family amidase